MRLSAFETYALFLALKNHFTQKSYDFFKYNGKTNASPDSFMGRRDRIQFQKLARRVDKEQMQDYIVANLIEGKSWVGDFLDDNATDNFMTYTKRKQALTYTFTNDLDRLFTSHTPTTVFKVTNNQLPPILNSLISREICPETFAIVDHYIGFSKIFDKKLGDDFIWSKSRSLATKLYPFIQYDKDKLRKILKDKIQEYSIDMKEAV